MATHEMPSWSHILSWQKREELDISEQESRLRSFRIWTEAYRSYGPCHARVSDKSVADTGWVTQEVALAAKLYVIYGVGSNQAIWSLDVIDQIGSDLDKVPDPLPPIVHYSN